MVEGLDCFFAETMSCEQHTDVVVSGGWSNDRREKFESLLMAALIGQGNAEIDGGTLMLGCNLQP